MVIPAKVTPKGIIPAKVTPKGAIPAKTGTQLTNRARRAHIIFDTRLRGNDHYF